MYHSWFTNVKICILYLGVSSTRLEDYAADFMAYLLCAMLLEWLFTYNIDVGSRRFIAQSSSIFDIGACFAYFL